MREFSFLSSLSIAHDHDYDHHTTTYDLRLRPSLFVEYARRGVEGGESSFPSLLFFCILLCKNGLPALAWRFSWCLHCCPLPISSPPRTSFFVCCDQLGVVREHVLLLISCVTIQTLWGHANACNRGHLPAHPRVEWVFGEKNDVTIRIYSSLYCPPTRRGVFALGYTVLVLESHDCPFTIKRSKRHAMDYCTLYLPVDEAYVRGHGSPFYLSPRECRGSCILIFFSKLVARHEEEGENRILESPI